jgi:hypothetical protein
MLLDLTARTQKVPPLIVSKPKCRTSSQRRIDMGQVWWRVKVDQKSKAMYNAPYLCTRGLVLTGNDSCSLPVNFVILGLVLQVKDMHLPVVVGFSLK